MRKPTLSPTKINTYLTCKVKYYWSYLSPYRKLRRPNPMMAFGANLHRVLQAFHEHGGAQHLSPQQTQHLLEQLWNDALFPNPELSQHHKQLGQNLLQQYHQLQSAQAEPARTLFTERLLRKDLGEFVLIGRLDRVDEYPDGTLEIVDYKSGRTHLTPEQVESDLALHCYALLLRTHYPERPLRTALYALQIHQKISLPVDPHALDAFEASIRQLGAQILSEDYSHLTPEPFHACAECDFLPLCKKHFWGTGDTADTV